MIFGQFAIQQVLERLKIVAMSMNEGILIQKNSSHSVGITQHCLNLLP